ncbi:hypothetical protein Q5752_005666 [Cryptotrichosporon argae]
MSLALGALRTSVLPSLALPAFVLPALLRTLAWPSALPAVPSLSALLELFPPFLLAVPKHKVTHSRKSMRSANKGLKNKTNLSHCEACGSLKLAHNLCPACFSQISRRWKKEQRGEIPPSFGPTP